MAGEDTPAKVLAKISRTGMAGEATQIKLQLLDGASKGRTIIRNVKGPIKVGDILMLRETSREARRLDIKVRS